MKTPNLGAFHIRKWFLLIDDALATESGEPADGDPVRKIVLAACVHNPFAGRHVADLDSWIDASAELGRDFGRRITEAAAGAAIEGYGKGTLVGLDGEYEHGKALLTTHALNAVRDAVGGGKAWVPSTGKRGVPGMVLDIPLAHKDALYVRSHYDTVSASFNDAPGRDEIVVCCAFATRGRLHARLGGLKASEVEGRDGLT